MSTARRKRKPRRTSRQLRHEPLELRQLLAGDLVISELLARNDNTLNDEDGASSDWLELYNPGDAAISTDGWYLTDEASNLTKWQLPAVDVGAGQYLLVFASGKDRAVAGAELHANFQLSGGGEYLALVMPDGVTVADEFAPAFPAQAVDVSYGVDESDLARKWYFAVATPGAANEMSSTFEGIVADTQFSVDRGFFDAPFEVEISTLTPGAEIHYTLDGSEPRGRSQLYTGPITVSTTSTLRAVAMKDNFLPTNVDTQTYIFIEDVLQQPNNPAGFPTSWGTAPAVDYEMDPAVVDDAAYTQDLRDGLRAIPTLSLVLGTPQMFGGSGLYSNPEDPNLETATSAEWILPDGSTGFQLDAGLKIQGGASRRPVRSPKHSMSLRFRDIYGPGTLDYPLFEDSPVTSFDSLQLRAMYNNSWIHWSRDQRPRGSLIRDQFMRDSLLAMGQIDAGRGTYAHLYINGLYWGVYNVHERQDSAHYAEYFGGTEDDYDARNGGTVIDGTNASYNRMQGIVDSGDWEAIQQAVDVDNYIDFTIIQRYGSNNDLQSGGNWRSAGGGPDNAPWKFYSWDSERVLEGVNEGGPGGTADPPNLLNDLLQIPEFVTRFGDRIQKHFFNGGALTPESTAARWQARADELHDAIVAESARWGDYRRDVHQDQCNNNGCDLYTRDDYWLPEQNRLMNTYFPFRSDNVVDQYRSLGIFPNEAAPQFNQHGGNVPAGFEVSLSGSGMIFYTLDGSDPMDGGIEYVAPFALNTSTTVHARTTTRGRWSPLVEATFIVDSPPVRISELMYHPADPPVGSVHANGDFEYIELVNIGAETIDLSSLRLSDGVQFDFAGAAITSLDPGGYVLVVSNQQAFESRYGAGRPIAGEYTGQLSNGGERITLQDNFGTSILDFVYDDAWYPETDGGGHSLVIVDAQIDPADWDLQASWRASHLTGGSPGADDVDRLPGDANGDGRVNIDDLNAVRNNFGAVGVDVEGDTNGDGVVNIDDLNAVRNNFGAMAAPQALPSPVVDRLSARKRVDINLSAPRRSRFAAIRGELREQLPSFIRLPRSARGHAPTPPASASVWDEALLRVTGERPLDRPVK